ncbi:hypothetical protein IFM89_017582 [Coptis chinensis]|uniref:Agenet domain-containing protein n=1 Tax=Coptis chinensis TaxID=261450 RepID=A0A835HYA9_9MAGN|nr:hypothetical protein IFM89_017582 [Coptis chinensis]
MEEAGFKEMQQVELRGEDEGYKDTWYTGKIIKFPNRKAKTWIFVEYDKLLASDEHGTRKPHRKFVNPCSIRPLPVKMPNEVVYECYQQVDAFYNNGWKKGLILKVHDKLPRRYTVYFPLSKEQVDFGAEMLRVPVDWVDGEWVKPQPQYFKRMKESNKKNAEDAKICPQIHQTDVFFQMKMRRKGGSSISYFGNQNKQMVITPSSATPSPQMILPVLQPLQPPQSEAEKKKKNKNGENMEDNQTSEQRFFEEGNSAPSSSALKRKATEPRFINGMQVEVSLPDKHCCGAWFPATVIKKTKSDSFFIQYNSLRLSVAAGLLRDIVHPKHIRPSPPENFRGIPFYVADKVDVFFYYGWWSGVITEVLPCNKCTVQFQHQSNRRTFNQNELRCHIEWISEESVQQLRV